MRPLLSLLAALLLALPAAGAPAPRRMSSPLGELRGVIEVRDLEAAAGEAAIREAFVAMRELVALFDPSGGASGGAGALDAAAGLGPRPVAADLGLLLQRALDFCAWSGGAHGPLGGRLRHLWGAGRPIAGPPPAAAVAAAVDSAACDRLRVDAARGEAELAAGSRLALEPFALGFIVDRAVEVLRRHGAANAWVELGPVKRALGPGPDGRGWRYRPPLPAGMERPLPAVRLRDQAVAVAGAEGLALLVGGRKLPALFDQRPPSLAPLTGTSGQPVDGVLEVVAVSELAVDAQGLAGSLYVLGASAGQMRLGSLRPPPAALWLLGRGDGAPLITTYRWSQIARD